MNIAYAVLQFVERARKRPQDAADPNLLDRLQRMAKRAWDGAFVAQYAPMAPDTWETDGQVLSADAETVLSPIKFGRPVFVLGFFPIVVPVPPVGPTALIAPTTNDFKISIETSNRRTFTQGRPDDTAGTTPVNFVSLSAMSVLSPRLIGRRLPDANPTLNMTIRPKRGPGVYMDAIVSVAIFTRYLGGDGVGGSLDPDGD